MMVNHRVYYKYIWVAQVRQRNVSSTFYSKLKLKGD